MSPKLKPLLLPQLVEERRRRESLSDPEMDSFSLSFQTQNSSASDIPSSPVTPTFSTRGHFRYPSSSSSIESAYHNSINDSPSSPTFLVKSGKRSLPDVQEEPHEREEEQFDLVEYENDLYNCLCDSQQCLHREPTMSQSSVQLSTRPQFDYDMAEGCFSDNDFSTSPRPKKRRNNESTFNGLATRFGTRFPSFSRKFKLRKGVSSASLKSDAMRDSNTTSSRSSLVSNYARPVPGLEFEHIQTPPTPTRSVYGREEATMAVDIERANRESAERDEGFATTPLLPPLMMDASANTKHINLQSPLQSPSVAEAKDPFTGGGGLHTPISANATPIPSPPLSTKPSISSFHRPGHLIPSCEIPAMTPLSPSSPTDEWAIKLGHANFTIQPEPYLPSIFDISACRTLRTDWDLARCNYTKHLVRTGEHYGVTSQTYKLTEEKWTATESLWRLYNETTIARTVESGNDAFTTLKHTAFGDRDVVTKIPSLNDLRSEGKFPQLGDGEIVGPMVQVPAVGGLRRSHSKKARVMKFIADKFPAGLMTAGRS